MIVIEKEEKKILISFLGALTYKITYHSPHIADLLLAD
jgi:hypothetical protein